VTIGANPMQFALLREQDLEVLEAPDGSGAA
jgi:hypothetical protein